MEQDNGSNKPQGSPQGCLNLKEKLAVTCLLLLLATVAACSFASKHKQLALSHKTIHIKCLGACSPQEDLELPCGVQISDVLARITVTEDADISKMVLEERLKAEGHLIIPSKGKMTLYIGGAVNTPGIIYVPEGLRYNQLKEYLALADDADVRIFHRRRRLLSEGETILIPAKSEYIVRK